MNLPYPVQKSDGPLGRAFCPKPASNLIFPALCCLGLTLLVAAASLIPEDLLRSTFGVPIKTPAAAQSYWVSRFFMWDSDWYDSIARLGYSWHPGTEQADNIAFFPLWPLLLRAILCMTGGGYSNRLCVLVLTAALGFASVFAFNRLSRQLLSSETARWAVAFYAFNPASNFLFRSYPVGLINLLTALCLYELVKRRYWRAAVLSGLASAAGPLAICLSLTVSLAAAFDREQSNRKIFPLVGITLLALSGILAFCAWSIWAFHDPAPFVPAQRGWGAALPLLQRVEIFLKLELIVPDIFQALKALWNTRSLVGIADGIGAEARLQNALGFAALAASLVGAWSCLALRKRFLVLQGLLLISAYLWLIGTNHGAYATMRLIYPALPCCLGLAILVKGRPVVSGMALLLSCLTMMFEEYLTLAGYWVI